MRPITIVLLLALLIGGIAVPPARAQGEDDPARDLPSVAAAAVVFDLAAAPQPLTTPEAVLGLVSGFMPAPPRPATAPLTLSDRLLLDRFLNDPLFEREALRRWTSHLMIVALESDGDYEPLIVLPIVDRAGAEAFVTSLTDRPEPDQIAGDILLYELPGYTVAISNRVVRIGIRGAVETAIVSAMGLGSLSFVRDYQDVRVALPADADVVIYASPMLTANFGRGATGILEVFLSLHPAENALKQAVRERVRLHGAGITMRADDAGGVAVEAAVVPAVEVDLPLPETAVGSELFAYLPAETNTVISGFDVTFDGGLFALLTMPMIGTVTSQIIGPDGTMTTQTETITPPSVSTVLPFAQVAITALEAFTGESLAQTHARFAGEYAIAVFDVANDIHAALWVRSESGGWLFDQLTRAAGTFVVDLEGTPLLPVLATDVNGTPALLLGQLGAVADPPMLLALDSQTLALTTQRGASSVVLAANRRDTREPRFDPVPGANLFFYGLSDSDDGVTDATATVRIEDGIFRVSVTIGTPDQRPPPSARFSHNLTPEP